MGQKVALAPKVGRKTGRLMVGSPVVAMAAPTTSNALSTAPRCLPSYIRRWKPRQCPDRSGEDGYRKNGRLGPLLRLTRDADGEGVEEGLIVDADPTFIQSSGERRRVLVGPVAIVRKPSAP